VRARALLFPVLLAAGLSATCSGHSASTDCQGKLQKACEERVRQRTERMCRAGFLPESGTPVESIRLNENEQAVCIEAWTERHPKYIAECMGQRRNECP
jgi:hypothetical protein